MGTQRLLPQSSSNRRPAPNGSWPRFAPCSTLVLIRTVQTETGSRHKVTLNALSTNQGRASWSLPDGVFFGSGARQKVAALFAGQGSQYIGMGRDLFCQFPRAESTLETTLPKGVDGSLGLDSLDFIELSVAIEDRFGVVIDESQDLTEQFLSFDSLSRFILAKTGQG